MNDTWARLSDLGFEAAMAGYVVALVCYAVEVASRRGGDVPADLVSEQRSASQRGATSTLTRHGGGGPGFGIGMGVIGALPPRAVTPWGERFGRAAVLVTAVGLTANVLSVTARGLATSRLPLGNMYEFTSVICAAAVLCWLVVLARTGARTMGMFVLLPVVILLFVAGTVLYVPAAPVVPALNSYWKWIHVTTVALSSSVLMVSGAASLLYLLRGRSDSRAVVGATGDGEPVSGRRGSLVDRLPSTATLDRIAYRTAIVAFPVYTFAVIAGAMWAEVAWGRYWGWDPKETCAFITWVIYASYLHARSTAGWRGQRAAIISVVGFVSVLFNLFFVNMVVSGLHSYAGLN